MNFLPYLLIQTGRNIRQTWGTQFMTLVTVSLSVLIFAFFFLVYSNFLKVGAKLGDELRLIVFLNEEIVPELRPQIERKILDFGEVEKIIFVSRHEAFTRLSNQLEEDRDVLADLGSDFLPPSIEVYPAKSLNSLARIKQFSDYLATLPGAAKVQYGHDWVERFGYVTNLLRLIVVLSGCLLILTTIFMVSYTIRLTVIARREELQIFRMLGATSAYIQGPLLIEGILQGLLGSSIGLASLFALFLWIKTRFSGPGILKLFDFTFFPPLTTGIILLTSILLCTGGSLVSIRKFLRV
ncbi:MAG: ABC transporter permease [Desulfobulbaceae bacterium]|nr:ABC transporter permease [Desulfobulbaceae bacterium]